MKLKRYNKFSIFQLLESYLTTDAEFYLILTKLRQVNTIANQLRSLVNQDIKTNVNFLSLGNMNDEIGFVNDKQVDRIVNAGEDPFKKSRNFQKVGRAVRQILTANDIKVTDKDIETFVNLYKNEWDSLNSPINAEIVSGEKIREWYHNDMYVSGGGTLNGSCMRYEVCQEYLSIYVDNPEVCQMVILKTAVDPEIPGRQQPSLLGRALLWKINDQEYYLDRIYTVNDHDQAKILKWVEKTLSEKKVLSHKNGDNINEVRVKLNNCEYDKYPYMDSLYILDVNNKLLMNQVINKTDLFYGFRDAGGEKQIYNWVKSRILDKFLAPGESIYDDHLGDYVPKSDCIPDFEGNLTYKPEAIFCKLYNGYYSKSGSRQGDWEGWVPQHEIIQVFDDGGSRNGKEIPRILAKGKWVPTVDQYGSYKFISVENAYRDPLGQYYMNRHRGSSMEVTDWNRRQIPVCQISTKGLKVISEERIMILYSEYPPFTIEDKAKTCKVWAWKDIPLAVEYFNKSGSMGPPVTTELVIELFGLKQVSDVVQLIPRRQLYNDMYNFNPIDNLLRDKIKKILSAKQHPDPVRHSARIDAYLADLASIDSSLTRFSNYYGISKRNIPIRGISKEARIRMCHRQLQKFWEKEGNNGIRKIVFNMKHYLLIPSRHQTLERMTNFFNRYRPFGINRRYNSVEFLDWYQSKLEVLVYYYYIWGITLNREYAAKETVQKFQDHNPNTYTWLVEHMYSHNSGDIGDYIYDRIEEPDFDYDDDDSDPNESLCVEWARTYLEKREDDLTDQNGERYIYTNINEGLNLFMSENFPELIKMVNQNV